MEKQLILKELALFSGAFPQEALQAAIDQYEEIKPDLLDLLKQSTKHELWIEGTKMDFGHLYAIYLLAQSKEQEAYPIIVEAVSKGEIDDLETVFGDFITGDLARTLASVCGGDVTLIKKLVEDSSVDGVVRCAALTSLEILMVNGAMARESLVEYLNHLLDILPRDSCAIWDGVFLTAFRIHPGELYDRLRKIWDEGLVDVSGISMSDMESVLEEEKETVLGELRDDLEMRYMGNAIDELISWDCFDPPKTEQEEQVKDTKPTPIVHATPKVGRNEPCPCGSGKKYKKCCG